MKKLLLITHDLAIGGLQQVVVNLCRFLDRGKFDISVLCLNALGEFAPEVEKLGIRVMLLPQRVVGPDYFSFFKVAKIVRDEGIEIIHSHNTQALIDGALAGLMSGVKRVVHTDHARAFPDKKRYMVAEWALSHLVYKVVGVSDHTCENLIQFEKINCSKIVMIPNGIDGRKFQRQIDKDAKRRELGVRLVGPVIGLGVRLAEQKGITFLLQAMPAILNRFPELTLLIAGDGPSRDSLEAEAVNIGIRNHVIFAGSRLDMDEILGMLDLYVLPSLWEGLPMVLLEALAARCPVVATDVGGVNMAIIDGETGCLVTPGRPEELSASVIRLLSDHALRGRCINNGFELFQKEFDAEMMAKSYERLYLA